MVQSSQRELRAVNPEWTIAELMSHIAKALASTGPALSFSPTTLTSIPEGIALVVSTTGSSGATKAVGLSATALLSSARASNKFLGAEVGSTWSLLLPLNHIAGINVLIRSMEVGTEPINLIGHAGVYPRVDFTAIVPTQLFKALNGDSELLSHLTSAKAVLIGGAALSPTLHMQAVDAGINVVITYGMTETSGGCVYNGTPLEGVDIQITPERQIAIQGSTLATTYLGAESLWETSLRDGWFIAADLGRIENDTLIVEGRSDDVFISGGENLSIGAIESALHKHFPHKHFAAFALDDVKWGQALHIAIAGEGFPSPIDVTEYLAEHFGAAAKPKGFLELAEFPLIGIGKIDRALLKKLLGEAPN